MPFFTPHAEHSLLDGYQRSASTAGACAGRAVALRLVVQLAPLLVEADVGGRTRQAAVGRAPFFRSGPRSPPPGFRGRDDSWVWLLSSDTSHGSAS
jgi:hypothetical protein